MNEIFLAALIFVESSGRDLARGDRNKALGCLQIHCGVITDVNMHYGTSYKLSDRRSRKKSKEICMMYLDMWAPDEDFYTLARIWHGGPRGHKKPETKAYAKAVLEYMEKHDI